jgi:hypothetical protein
VRARRSTRRLNESPLTMALCAVRAMIMIPGT